MIPKQGGSFIPNRSTGKISKKRFNKRIYLLGYISNVILFATLLAVAGMFFIQKQVNKQLEVYVARVDTERQLIDRSQIESVRNLNSKLKTAQQILDWHVAPSVLFDDLESVIISPIQLTSFKYTKETGRPAELVIEGDTNTFDALLFQRDYLSTSSSTALINTEISDISYTPSSVDGGSELGSETKNTTSITFTFKNPVGVSAFAYQPRSSLDTDFSQTVDNPNSTASSTIGTTDGSDNVLNNVIE